MAELIWTEADSERVRAWVAEAVALIPEPLLQLAQANEENAILKERLREAEERAEQAEEQKLELHTEVLVEVGRWKQRVDQAEAKLRKAEEEGSGYRAIIATAENRAKAFQARAEIAEALLTLEEQC